MSEQEYIYVRDLSNVMTAEHAIRDMNPGHNGLDEDEHVEVCRILHRWRETLFEKIHESRGPDEEDEDEGDDPFPTEKRP